MTLPHRHGNEARNETRDKWVAELQKIYDERTAGDHTWSGVLAEFYQEMKRAEVRDIEANYQEALATGYK
jgi:hypothetical protein